MLLLNVVEYRQPISFQDLAAAANLPKTTTHRLVSALEVHGFLHRDEHGAFVSGSHFATATLAQVARPILTQLSDTTGESSQLFVRRGLQRLVIVSIESREELRTIVPVGALLPIDKGSSGRLLAGDAKSLRRGWADSVGERVAGIASVSAAILDAGQVVAAVCLSGPTERLGPKPGRRYSQVLIAAANDIQIALATSHH